MPEDTAMSGSVPVAPVIEGQRRILVYANRENELAALTSRLNADGHTISGTIVGEVAVDLTSASNFDAFMIDSHVPTPEQLKLTAEIARRNPGILIIRVNGPEAASIQLRQALNERRAALAKTRNEEDSEDE